MRYLKFLNCGGLKEAQWSKCVDKSDLVGRAMFL